MKGNVSIEQTYSPFLSFFRVRSQRPRFVHALLPPLQSEEALFKCQCFRIRLCNRHRVTLTLTQNFLRIERLLSTRDFILSDIICVTTPTNERVELFFKCQKSILLDIDAAKAKEFVEHLKVSDIRFKNSKKWKQGKMSTFQYLNCLNLLHGRSFNSIDSYPVFPFLSKSQTRSFKSAYSPDPSSHRVGFWNGHIMPFSEFIEGELFSRKDKENVQRETTPEFYSVHAATGMDVYGVYEMRHLLESKEVSSGIHEWFDLIFGLRTHPQKREFEDSKEYFEKALGLRRAVYARWCNSFIGITENGCLYNGKDVTNVHVTDIFNYRQGVICVDRESASVIFIQKQSTTTQTVALNKVDFVTAAFNTLVLSDSSGNLIEWSAELQKKMRPAVLDELIDLAADRGVDLVVCVLQVGLVCFYSFTDFDFYASYDLGCASVLKVLITPGWGFVWIELETSVIVLDINGSFIHSFEKEWDIKSWIGLTNKSGFDFVALVAGDGHVVVHDALTTEKRTIKGIQNAIWVTSTPSVCGVSVCLETGRTILLPFVCD